MKKTEYDKLISYIKNGITLVDGTIKAFDIVDYYNIFSENILDLYFKKEDQQGGRILKNFIAENLGTVVFSVEYSDSRFNNKRNVDGLLKTDIELFAKFDEAGNYIPGSGIKITESQKIEAYDFLKINNNFVTAKGLMRIFNRFAQGYTLSTEVATKKLNRKK